MQVIDSTTSRGIGVAIWCPQDHEALHDGDDSMAIHNDCISHDGLNGYDGNAFYLAIDGSRAAAAKRMYRVLRKEVSDPVRLAVRSIIEPT
jgi:hypothetical protein